MVSRVRLDWLLVVQPLAFLRIQDACIYKGNKTYLNLN